MIQYDLDKGTRQSVTEACKAAENPLIERAAWFFYGAAKNAGGTPTIDHHVRQIIHGYDHPIRVLVCDLRQKQEKGRMWWKLEGEPGEYLALMYVGNSGTPTAYLVGFGPYEALAKKAVDGELVAKRQNTASKWVTLDFLTGSEEPW